jgi:hypothetical protein
LAADLKFGVLQVDRGGHHIAAIEVADQVKNAEQRGSSIGYRVAVDPRTAIGLCVAQRRPAPDDNKQQHPRSFHVSKTQPA